MLARRRAFLACSKGREGSAISRALQEEDSRGLGLSGTITLAPSSVLLRSNSAASNASACASSASTRARSARSSATDLRGGGVGDLECRRCMIGERGGRRDEE